MSIELSLGDAPPALSLPPDSLGVDFSPEAPDAPAAPAAPAPELVQLTETFGGDFTGFSSVEDAQRAALLIAQSYAQAGVAPPAQPQPPAGYATSTNAPPAQEEIDYSALGDLDPKVAAILKKLDGDLKTTRTEARQFQERLANEQSAMQQQQNQELLNRALGAIDGLADARYGVGGNQNFSQQMARENLLRTADRIVQGMRAAGRTPPTIEKLIGMAVLAESGKLPAPPKAAGAGRPGAPPAPLAGGTQPPQPSGFQRRKTGGEVDTYMQDADFMNGARAIVQRGRR